MTHFLRSALLLCGSLTAIFVAPAQAGRSSATPTEVPAAAIPEAPLPQLIDPQGLPVLSEPAATAPVVASPDAETSVVSDLEAKSATLAALVDRFRSSVAGSRELECLATGIYFESKSEPLAGQLAVGRVIANRASSGGRFPGSYCGVLFQRGQFSFIRGASLPTVPRNSRQWLTAVAMAKIVHQKLKDSSVGNALFFHARRVAPNWHLKRVAEIGNHIFYR